MKMYRTRFWGNEITEYDCIRTTDKSIFYLDNNKECQERLESNYHKWHSSKEESILFLRGQLQKDVEILTRRLSDAKNKLSQFEETYGKP